MHFGSRIDQLRKDKGYTQVKFAAMCRITCGYLSKIENGIKYPSGDLLRTICRLLDIDIAFFVWSSIESIDVPDSNNQLFVKTRPLVDALVGEWFSKNPTYC